jgi:hypothetical protein
MKDEKCWDGLRNDKIEERRGESDIKGKIMEMKAV